MTDKELKAIQFLCNAQGNTSSSLKHMQESIQKQLVCSSYAAHNLILELRRRGILRKDGQRYKINRSHLYLHILETKLNDHQYAKERERVLAYCIFYFELHAPVYNTVYSLSRHAATLLNLTYKESKAIFYQLRDEGYLKTKPGRGLIHFDAERAKEEIKIPSSPYERMSSEELGAIPAKDIHTVEDFLLIRRLMAERSV